MMHLTIYRLTARSLHTLYYQGLVNRNDHAICNVDNNNKRNEFTKKIFVSTKHILNNWMKEAQLPRIRII